MIFEISTLIFFLNIIKMDPNKPPQTIGHEKEEILLFSEGLLLRV